MRLDLIFASLILLSGCAATEQEDYGWVAMPKSSVHRVYNNSPYASDREDHRTYAYSQDGKLDSIIEDDQWGRTVYSGFHVASLRLQSEHSSHSYNVVPWDASLAATVRRYYSHDSSGTWRQQSIEVDSLIGDQLKSSTAISYGSRPSVIWRGSIYDAGGHLIGAGMFGGSEEGYRYYYHYDNSCLTQLTSTFRGRPLAKGNLSQMVTDTVGIYLFRYDSTSRLAGIDVQTFEGQNHREYARQENISHIKVSDSIFVLSRDKYKYLLRVSPITELAVSYIKDATSSSGPYRMTFSATLDDRHRIIQVMEQDSNETRISYFDDNTIRETWRIGHHEGKSYETLTSWQEREHDASKGVTKIEFYYRDNDNKVEKYREDEFEY